MTNHHEIEKIVSRYIDGDMSEIEKLDFQSRLVTDPVLQEEYSLQKDMVEAIKIYRRAELKSKLSHVQLPTTAWYQTLGGQIAATASITAMVGLGAYLYFSQPSEVFSVVEIDALTYAQNLQGDVPEMPIAYIQESEHADQNLISDVTHDDEVPANHEISNDAIAQIRELPKPEIIVPELAIIDDGRDFEAPDGGFESSVSSFEKLSEKVAVETLKGVKKGLHYRFTGNKLFLYGDFGDQTYEIIEINTQKGRRFYLLFDGNFFQILQNQTDIAPLERIKDEEIINDLEIMLRNK
ncbi:MAG: hypothetical protein JJU28_09205 [Cyclobacteriaceae bacterium]|nr:hypothetical protein [Cyclobacteriaceae bacterium]